MPEAPVNEYDFPQARENQIRVPGQLSPVQPVSETHAMHKASDCHLRLRVLGPDTPHQLASLGGRQCVHRLIAFETL
jgi:hypothetical protein